MWKYNRPRCVTCAITLALVVVGLHLYHFSFFKDDETLEKFQGQSRVETKGSASPSNGSVDGQKASDGGEAQPRGNAYTFGDYEQTLCLTPLKKIEVPAEWSNRCPKGGIVSVGQGGRLGNQMWEYVSVYAVARRSGLEAFVPRCLLEILEEHFEKMNIPPMSYIGDCPMDKKRLVHWLYEWNKKPDQSIILPKYVLGWATASQWFEDIRREFVFRVELRDNARAVLASLSERFNVSKPTFVGVHVRRTDYIEHLRKIYKLSPAPVSFYHNGMDYFERKYENVIFVVASDSPEWCRENLRREKSRIDVISEPNEKGPGRDMAVMSFCNHSLYDYGTFGDWGAILAGGETVVYNASRYPTAVGAKSVPNWKIMD